MSTLVLGPTAGHDTGWKRIESDTGADIAYENPNFGRFEYGWGKEGYDQPLFIENQGGGSLVVCFGIAMGTVMILMRHRNRYNLVGSEIWPGVIDIEIPGGFANIGEEKMQTGIRELLEETGVEIGEVREIPGRLFGTNRAMWYIGGEHEGVSVYCCQIGGELTNTARYHWLPWQEAVNLTRDALSGMAIARLVASFADFLIVRPID